MGVRNDERTQTPSLIGQVLDDLNQRCTDSELSSGRFAETTQLRQTFRWAIGVSASEYRQIFSPGRE